MASSAAKAVSVRNNSSRLKPPRGLRPDEIIRSNPSRSILEKYFNTNNKASSLQLRDKVLNLKLELTESCNETGSHTKYDVQTACKAAKASKSAAFSEWLSEKRKIESNTLARKKKLEEEKQRLREEKKILAQQKYQEWLTKKAKAKEQQTARDLQQELQLYQPRRNDVFPTKFRVPELKAKHTDQPEKLWQNSSSRSQYNPKTRVANKGFVKYRGAETDIFVRSNSPHDVNDSYDEDY